MTVKPVRPAPVPPAMDRVSVIDAVPAGICLVNWTGAMPMKENITINLNTVPQSCRIWAALFYITDRTVVSGIMLDEYDVIFYWRRYT